VLWITFSGHDERAVTKAMEDTGTGIDPNATDRVFDLTFTTKAHRLGMGLSICCSTIEAHGGRIWRCARFSHLRSQIRVDLLPYSETMRSAFAFGPLNDPASKPTNACL
jgi:K+-sensing histidine kinase KdpD